MNAVGTNPHENVCPKIGGKLLLHFDIGVRYSVTRLGDFLNFFATNFLTLVAKIFHDFCGLFRTSCLKLKTTMSTFGQLLRKLGRFYSNIWSHWFGSSNLLHV